MGNRSSSMLQDDEIISISEETGFTPTQVERLYSRFIALDKSGNGSLGRQNCLAIPELAINPLCDRIVQMFFTDCDQDQERINFRQFMKVLATCFPKSRKQKLHFIFKLYDVDNDDRLSLDDVKSILKTMVGKCIDEDKIHDLAVKTLNKVDKNGSGYIEFDEFCEEFKHRDIEEALRVKFPSK